LSGLVLIVDDVPSNIQLLASKLENEFFEVITAGNGAEAIEVAKAQQPDVILMDVMMPEMDGFEATQKLKLDPTTAHIPVIMVTSLSEPEDRVQGLESGADEFLTKPPDSVELLSRVRSLIRLKRISDEWRVRQQMMDQFDVPVPLIDDETSYKNASILGVDLEDDVRAIMSKLAPQDENTLEEVSGEPEEFKDLLETTDFDLIVIPFMGDVKSKVRLCSTLRTIDMSRHTPILIMVPEQYKTVVGPALDVGVNDYIMLPVNIDEFQARLRTQIRKKRYHKALKDGYERSLAMALTDPLTGLYNRRYAESHLNKMVGAGAVKANRAVSVLMIDIDFFKNVNDTHGHQAGDDILKEVAARLQKHIRNFDLVARMGGEEFICILPDTKPDIAMMAAERLRNAIGGEKIHAAAVGKDLEITISIGIGHAPVAGDATSEQLVKEADQALYKAKHEGRNCVKAA